MTVQLAIRIPDQQVAELDRVVGEGRFATRTAAIRAAVDLLVKTMRERKIVERYHAGYGKHPQEEWLGEVGLRLLDAYVASEEKDQPPL